MYLHSLDELLEGSAVGGDRGGILPRSLEAFDTCLNGNHRAST